MPFLWNWDAALALSSLAKQNSVSANKTAEQTGASESPFQWCFKSSSPLNTFVWKTLSREALVNSFPCSCSGFYLLSEKVEDPKHWASWSSESFQGCTCKWLHQHVMCGAVRWLRVRESMQPSVRVVGQVRFIVHIFQYRASVQQPCLQLDPVIKAIVCILRMWKSNLLVLWSEILRNHFSFKGRQTSFPVVCKATRVPFTQHPEKETHPMLELWCLLRTGGGQAAVRKPSTIAGLHGALSNTMSPEHSNPVITTRA
jgi:hypothetical protein